MKKKTLALLLAGAMCISLFAGCGSSSETAEGAQAEEAAATEEPVQSGAGGYPETGAGRREDSILKTGRKRAWRK